MDIHDPRVPFLLPLVPDNGWHTLRLVSNPSPNPDRSPKPDFIKPNQPTYSSCTQFVSTIFSNIWLVVSAAATKSRGSRHNRARPDVVDRRTCKQSEFGERPVGHVKKGLTHTSPGVLTNEQDLSGLIPTWGVP